MIRFSENAKIINPFQSLDCIVKTRNTEVWGSITRLARTNSAGASRRACYIHAPAPVHFVDSHSFIFADGIVIIKSALDYTLPGKFQAPDVNEPTAKWADCEQISAECHC